MRTPLSSFPTWGVVALVLAGTLESPRAAGAAEARRFNEEVARKLASVAEWRGHFEMEWSGSGSQPTENTPLNRGSADCRSHGTFVLKRGAARDGWDAAAGMFIWRGQTEVTFSGQSSYSSRSRNGEETEWRAEARGGAKLDWTELTIWMDQSFAKFHWGGGGATQDRVSVHRSGHYVVRGSGGRLQRLPIDERGDLSVYLPNHHQTDRGGERRTVEWWPQFSGGPGLITINTTVTDAGALELSWFALPMRSRVLLYPVYDDLECEVTIPGYAEWLPQGNIAEPTRPGGTLVAHAVLKSKSGKTKDLPEVDRFRFELIDTSREPGICLNWPLGARDRDYDLKFADIGAGGGTPDQLAALRKFFSDWGMMSAGAYDRENLPPGGLPPLSFGTVSDDGQKAELLAPTKDRAGQPCADAAIDCYDFGAKAELRVVCVLRDGREIIGLMQGPGGTQDLVRLPKRAGPDWVAEKWRKDSEALNLAMNADDEKIDGQPMNGDGFTLYEEYRGWIVGGRHITGDPRRKDFFVLNQRGADFRGGIDLFRRLSQLRVHSTLRDRKEINEDDRCMNRNHRDAPHLVDQHGVVLKAGNGFPGGDTRGVEGAERGRAFRPRSVAFIFMEGSEAGHGGNLLSVKKGTEQFNLSTRDAELAWDRGVAHELLHAVGVDHHGEAVRTKRACYFQGATAPLNPTGRHRYVSDYSLSPEFYVRESRPPLGEDWSNDRGAEITLLWEDTRRNVFEDQLAEYERTLKVYRDSTASEINLKYLAELAPRLAYTGKSADWWGRYIDHEGAGHALTRLIWIGAKNGTDSGNDLCVMKYYFANAYAIDGRENAYYLIRPGAVHAGRQICRHPRGTEANASDHQPQPRFGDAAGGRGDCFSQICPNDAIPPRSVVIK